MNEPRMYCRFCGARLKRDTVGKYCPTRNCQWQHGIPEEEEGKPAKRRKKK